MNSPVMETKTNNPIPIFHLAYGMIADAIIAACDYLCKDVVDVESEEIWSPALKVASEKIEAYAESNPTLFAEAPFIMIIDVHGFYKIKITYQACAAYWEIYRHVIKEVKQPLMDIGRFVAVRWDTHYISSEVTLEKMDPKLMPDESCPCAACADVRLETHLESFEDSQKETELFEAHKIMVSLELIKMIAEYPARYAGLLKEVVSCGFKDAETFDDLALEIDVWDKFDDESKHLNELHFWIIKQKLVALVFKYANQVR